MRLLPVLLLLPTTALAEDCTQRLQSLLATDLTADGPYTAMNTNMMAGMEQSFRQSFLSDRHFLVETIAPPGQPDTLHYEGGAWHSDGAGGWTLAWQTDGDEAAQGMEDQRQQMAAAVETATCTEGETTDEITGTLGPTPTFGPQMTVGYILDAGTGQVLEMTYAYVLNGMPITAHYEFSRAPGLTLPLPPGAESGAETK
jgi:hypothetical protein